MSLAFNFLDGFGYQVSPDGPKSLGNLSRDVTGFRSGIGSLLPHDRLSNTSNNSNLAFRGRLQAPQMTRLNSSDF